MQSTGLGARDETKVSVLTSVKQIVESTIKTILETEKFHEELEGCWLPL